MSQSSNNVAGSGPQIPFYEQILEVTANVNEKARIKGRAVTWKVGPNYYGNDQFRGLNWVPDDGLLYLATRAAAVGPGGNGGNGGSTNSTAIRPHRGSAVGGRGVAAGGNEGFLEGYFGTRPGHFEQRPRTEGR